MAYVIAEYAPICPVSAIFALDDLPDQWSHFAQISADHFGREGK
ncbi:MAG TPA: hypothetical protein VEV17_22200 [Bryobacteraceae bacterium]|nr:hypothetical protein [Bryobacteraceae bacterium]